MHYGIDYYPEHEDETRWALDAQLMVQAGFTTVRLAEFAWARLEPQPGQYTFDWLDQVITTLTDAKLHIVLGTPTAAPPQWLSAAQPEILLVNSQGQRMAPHSRRFVCLNSTEYRAATTAIVTAMAKRYGQHPAVVAWQIDNEFGCHHSTRCTCPTCQTAFREWLQARYSSLAALNTAWGTGFWGQEYSDWSQVSLPAPTLYDYNPGYMLDTYRFGSDSTCAYQQIQIAILREFAPKQLLCHNLMGDFPDLDYAALAEPLDFVAWDNYMRGFARWQDAARTHDAMRGLKDRPFWVIESPPGQVNWTTYNPDLQPGEARLNSLQAVAHGCDGLFYFHWRAFRGGAEQYHSAILPHDGIPGRIYAEASTLGHELAELRPLLTDTTVKAEVAIVTDMSSFWALHYQPHSRALANPHDYVQPWYDAFCKQNIAVTFCRPDEDLNRYKLVIAPMLHVVTPAIAANLQHYVKQGGTLLLGPRSGFKDAGNCVTELPLPGLLGSLAGVRVAEWAALPPDETRCVRGSTLGSREYQASLWRELLELRGAYPIAYYGCGSEQGQVAIAANPYGAGITWYVGVLGATIIDAVVAYHIREQGLVGALATPDGVEACMRQGANGKLLFLLNHTASEHTVDLPSEWQAVSAVLPSEGRVRLKPLDVAIFRQPAPRNNPLSIEPSL
jgi:beta-galactosidase